MNSDILISTHHLSFTYNETPVLEDITLDIHRGEFLGIIGPNGSGKTTLLKLMLGLLTPTKGTVKLFNTPISDFSDWSRIGYVPQKVSSAATFPITVEEVVAMGITSNKRWFDFMTTADKDAVTKALQAVDLEKKRTALLNELSGGQQQRAFIARALVSHPDLLLLDEPTVGVDSDSQAKFYELLRDLNKQLQLTLVLVSHDIEVVAHEVTQVACINRKLILHGQPKKVLTGNFMEKLYGKDVRMVVHGH